MSFAISGKTAIVTGGANGIGLAIGRHFLDKGANVIFADMDEENLIRELGPNEEGNPHRYFAGDLREKLTLANLLSATLDAFDTVDILVNASRQIILTDPLNSDEAMQVMLQQNLMTTLKLSQMVAKRMIKQADGADGLEGGAAGTIVNVCCIASRRTAPELLAYSVASAALDQLTRSLAVAMAPKGIRVNGLAFGSVMSNSLKETLRENGEYREEIEARTPLGRIAAPTELTEAAQFLASDASGFMTGQIVTVDGGRTLMDPVTAPAH